ncbi:glutathione S-transferase [Shewanella pneumatophori]|uniref:Glutathione S-transferase n=1 Tax=Shewanella pneumatophori TaxID=314092 RepID=A0A9X1ZBH2_9GAMM|nr:glutathione S-transferase [Shewanella pneumatophori]MCL1139179.1 glutathione S-transferase [Shewanella pneumatophori]
MKKPLPVLYSLRNCPYAMRARLAIFASEQTVCLREVLLSQKPAQMLTASPKGTVPVLVLPSGEVLEQSRDIMLWAFAQSDLNNYQLHQPLANGKQSEAATVQQLMTQFDSEFIPRLEHYRSAKRYRDPKLLQYRAECEIYLQQLESRLAQHDFLFGGKACLADVAIMPFIRQFARVERQWYLQSPYPEVRRWLDGYLQSAMFSKVMAQYPVWTEGANETLFGGDKA